MISTLIILASLMGAGGVVLAAAAAHAAPGAGLDSAAYLLLFHALAILGAARRAGLALAAGGAHRDGRLRDWRRAVRRRRLHARPLPATGCFRLPRPPAAPSSSSRGSSSALRQLS
jgi:hypothetical protein